MSSSAQEGFQVDQSAPLPSFRQLKASAAENLTPEEESQRQIEEWMIAEGVNLGPEHPVADANALQMQQQPMQPPPQPHQHHVALKIPNVTHLSMSDFPSPSDSLPNIPTLPQVPLPPPASSSSLSIPPFITLRTLLPLKTLQHPVPLAELAALPTTPVTPSPLTPTTPMTPPHLGGK